MRRYAPTFFLLVVAVLFVFAWSESGESQPRSAQPLPTIEVFFSPKGGCTEAVIRELGKAKKMVLVQAFSFTSAPIAKALV